MAVARTLLLWRYQSTLWTPSSAAFVIVGGNTVHTTRCEGGDDADADANIHDDFDPFKARSNKPNSSSSSSNNNSSSSYNSEAFRPSLHPNYGDTTTAAAAAATTTTTTPTPSNSHFDQDEQVEQYYASTANRSCFSCMVVSVVTSSVFAAYFANIGVKLPAIMAERKTNKWQPHKIVWGQRLCFFTSALWAMGAVHNALNY